MTLRSADTWRRIQYWALVTFAVMLPLGQVPTEAALIVGLLAWAVSAICGHRKMSVFNPAIAPRPLAVGDMVMRQPMGGRDVAPHGAWSQAPPRQGGVGLHSPLDWLLLAWFVAALCSMRNSVDLGASLKGLQKLLKYGGLYFLVFHTIDSWDALKGVLKGAAVGLLIVVGDGLWQAVFGKDLFYGYLPAYTFETVKRIAATFHHPANLAIHLVSVCPVILAWALSSGRTRRRWMLLTLVGVTAVVLLMSRTRGGFLGFVCALVILGYWLRRWTPIVLAAALCVVQALTVPPEVKAWSATMPSLLHRLTEPERLMYWQAALNMIRAHPLIGVGVNTFIEAYPSFRSAGDHFGTTGPYAHNQYLHLTAELGFIGLTIFLLLMIHTFLVLYRQQIRYPRTSFEWAVSAGLGAGLVGYLLIGLFESALFYARGSLVFWLLVGLLMAVGRLDAHSVASGHT